jgi:hypothetical protein
MDIEASIEPDRPSLWTKESVQAHNAGHRLQLCPHASDSAQLRGRANGKADQDAAQRNEESAPFVQFSSQKHPAPGSLNSVPFELFNFGTILNDDVLTNCQRQAVKERFTVRMGDKGVGWHAVPPHTFLGTFLLRCRFSLSSLYAGPTIIPSLLNILSS